MSYQFNFDLTNVSEALFDEITKVFETKRCKGTRRKARQIADKLKIQNSLDLSNSAAIKVVKDIMDNFIENLSYRDEFLKRKNRALFLPHFSRKYMDSRCKSVFDKETSSYKCMHCSPDCIINKATCLGEKKGYLVYILPGGSCIKKIIEKKKHESVVGVACCDEIKLGRNYLKMMGIPTLGVPLVKNGCCDTNFSLKILQNVLEKGK
ncbi:MAG: DUF116 domain-containing protein [Promethearchaeota archaeon]